MLWPDESLIATNTLKTNKVVEIKLQVDVRRRPITIIEGPTILKVSHSNAAQTVVLCIYAGFEAIKSYVGIQSIKPAIDAEATRLMGNTVEYADVRWTSLSFNESESPL